MVFSVLFQRWLPFGVPGGHRRFSGGFVKCQSATALALSRTILPEKSSGTDKCERLWRDLFSDPSQWWDNRSEKPSPKFPDFKHKLTGKPLWVIDEHNPSWVAAEIASIPPGLSIFSWARRLSRQNKAQRYERTLQLFEQMQQEGMNGDSYIFIHVLNACAALQFLEQGRRIHGLIIETGCESNLYVSSSLVDMYAKCGSIDEAWKVFDKMAVRDVVVWTTMIQGLVKSGQGLKALVLFQQMQAADIEPDPVIFVGVLNACARVRRLEEGRRVHQQIVRRGCESDVCVGNSLVDMYVKCGSIDEARTVFENMATCDVVTWNGMIMGSLKSGGELQALGLFQQMQLAGVEPNSVTFLILLNACASLADLEEGRLVHEQIIRSGHGSQLYVASSLVDMYAKCGSLGDARRVFDTLQTRNVVTWNGMILGYVKTGRWVDALELFTQMQQEGVEPDRITFVGVLSACARIAALGKGKLVHELIIRSGCQSDLYVCNSLVDMYAKCGSIDEARTVFDSMPTRDVVGWNSMIMGYAMHGHAHEAVTLFEQMLRAGVEVNAVTFIGLLSACSHGGLVKEGIHYFETMRSVHGVSPSQEHHTCIVDILGRAGLLEDAKEMLKMMTLEPTAASWMSLLGACRIHSNVEMGERAARRLLELDPKNSSGYVLLSNIYAAAGHASTHCSGTETEECSKERARASSD